MRRIIARFVVVTPVFLGGNGQQAELRAPSIKAGLRFWWRTLAWVRLGGDREAIRREEDHLFGAAGDDGDRGRGQAVFLLRLQPGRTAIVPAGQVLAGGTRDRLVPLGAGARYFGYGLMEAFARNGLKAGQLVRSCLPEATAFTVDLTLTPRATDDDARRLLETIRIFGLIGGLGARSRRGWGSVALTRLTAEGFDGGAPWVEPATVTDYHARLKDELPAPVPGGALPPYTAFSGLSRVDLLCEGDHPLTALDQVGSAMQLYRGWGHRGERDRDHRIDGQPAEQNFREDHDWYKTVKSSRRLPPPPVGRPRFHPERIAFGLPQVYDQDVTVRSEGCNRRASPLLIHVHRCADGRSCAVATYLPAQFLPPNDGIVVQLRNKPATKPPIPVQDGRSVIEGFLDGHDRKGTGKRRVYFAHSRKVFPS